MAADMLRNRRPIKHLYIPFHKMVVTVRSNIGTDDMIDRTEWPELPDVFCASNRH